jgi:hypothetical protein
MIIKRKFSAIIVLCIPKANKGRINYKHTQTQKQTTKTNTKQTTKMASTKTFLNNIKQIILTKSKYTGTEKIHADIVSHINEVVSDNIGTGLFGKFAKEDQKHLTDIVNKLFETIDKIGTYDKNEYSELRAKKQFQVHSNDYHLSEKEKYILREYDFHSYLCRRTKQLIDQI